MNFPVRYLSLLNWGRVRMAKNISTKPQLKQKPLRKWVRIITYYNPQYLVGGFKHFLFAMSYMGCHPSHWRTPSFFKMVIAPPTSKKLASENQKNQTDPHENMISIQIWVCTYYIYTLYYIHFILYYIDIYNILYIIYDTLYIIIYIHMGIFHT